MPIFVRFPTVMTLIIWLIIVYTVHIKKAEFDEFREEHYNNSYIADCEAVLKFAPNNKQALSLKNYFLEQKIIDMDNGLDKE